ncbi:MAG: glycine zipper 2TM domain-containing protein [Comamonas sp.]|jgi:osmotically inducible lipoprotein OsmB|nr:glycine zipper 2TM domain-containing protein [Comamonas sp.]
MQRVKTISTAVALTAMLALTGCANNQQLGTGVGAVAGGVVGDAVLGGTLGTLGGAAAGAVIGNQIGKGQDRK